MMHARPVRLLVLAALLAVLAGCFSEQSFPAVEARLRRLTPEEAAPAGRRLAAREWAALAHSRMSGLLPVCSRFALTTDTFADASARVIDPYATFCINRAWLDNLLLNLGGLQQTAQVSSPDPEDDDRAAWAGFETLEIPTPDGAFLCARLGPPVKGDLSGSYVVLTHGLFGSMYGVDVQNHIAALRNAGHHVLALEMRGHGVTFKKYPKQAITFGACEAPDLLAVARFLKTRRGAKRVGLVSFSLTGYESILAAWEDGGGLAEPRFAGMALTQGVPPPDAAPAFDAGMFIVSPPVNFIETGQAFDRAYTAFDGPVKWVFQRKAAKRMAERGEAPSHRIWDFAASEFKRSTLAARYPDFSLFQRDLLALIDLQVGDWAEGRRRLEKVRAPLLVIEAANDPLATAHGVAGLFTGTKNPNCAALILAQGGHMGFPAASADYYYSLMLSFLDPRTGPAAVAK